MNGQPASTCWFSVHADNEAKEEEEEEEETHPWATPTTKAGKDVGRRRVGYKHLVTQTSKRRAAKNQVADVRRTEKEGYTDSEG